jgi:hypothetical protein
VLHGLRTPVSPKGRGGVYLGRPKYIVKKKIFELQRVTPNDKIPAIKYLGVYFDQNLNFKFHISQISKKLSHAIYSLRAVKNIFPKKYLRTLYFSLFHCHLIYALEVWSCVSPALLQPLIKKQKVGRYNILNLSSNLYLSYLYRILLLSLI